MKHQSARKSLNCYLISGAKVRKHSKTTTKILHFPLPGSSDKECYASFMDDPALGSFFSEELDYALTFKRGDLRLTFN